MMLAAVSTYYPEKHRIEMKNAKLLQVLVSNPNPSQLQV